MAEAKAVAPGQRALFESGRRTGAARDVWAIGREATPARERVGPLECQRPRRGGAARAPTCQEAPDRLTRIFAMPIYEYYCPDNHTIYQFYAKTLAQGRTVPRCPDNPKFRMEKMLSPFAVTSGGKESDEATPPAGVAGNPGEDARMEAAMGAMEREFSNVDENDPRAMARMMRR